MHVIFLAFFTFFVTSSSAAYSKSIQDINSDNPICFGSVSRILTGEEGFASVVLLVPAGEADAIGSEGVAHFTEHLVWNQFKRKFPSYDIKNYDVHTTSRATVFSFRVELDKLQDSLNALSYIFSKIDLPDYDINAELKEVGRELDRAIAADPYFVARRAGIKALHGDHKLGRSVLGLPVSISSLSKSDAVAFHSDNYKARDSDLFIYTNYNIDLAVPPPCNSEHADVNPGITSLESPDEDFVIIESKQSANNALMVFSLIEFACGNNARCDALSDISYEYIMRSLEHLIQAQHEDYGADIQHYGNGIFRFHLWTAGDLQPHRSIETVSEAIAARTAAEINDGEIDLVKESVIDYHSLNSNYFIESKRLEDSGRLISSNLRPYTLLRYKETMETIETGDIANLIEALLQTPFGVTVRVE